MGSDSNPTPQTITQKSDSSPWSEQQPFLKSGFQSAQDNVLNRPLSYFDGSTVVGSDPATTQGLNMTEQRAQAGSPLTGQAQGEISNTLNGNYLSGGNPAYQGMVDRSIQPLRQEYQNTVTPGIDGNFAGAGRYGSNSFNTARGQAADSYMRNVGDISSGLAYQNYNDERGRMQSAAGMAPALAQADYADAGMLGQVGAQREAQSQAQLQDQVNRFNFNQSEPTNRLAQYMGLIGGGYGGSSTASSVVPAQQGGNSLLTGLGAGAAGIGALSSLYGGSNPLFTAPWK